MTAENSKWWEIATDRPIATLAVERLLNCEPGIAYYSRVIRSSNPDKLTQIEFDMGLDYSASANGAIPPKFRLTEVVLGIQAYCAQEWREEKVVKIQLVRDFLIPSLLRVLTEDYRNRYSQEDIDQAIQETAGFIDNAFLNS